MEPNLPNWSNERAENVLKFAMVPNNTIYGNAQRRAEEEARAEAEREARVRAEEDAAIAEVVAMNKARVNAEERKLARLAAAKKKKVDEELRRTKEMENIEKSTALASFTESREILVKMGKLFNSMYNVNANVIVIVKKGDIKILVVPFSQVPFLNKLFEENHENLRDSFYCQLQVMYKLHSIYRERVSTNNTNPVFNSFFAILDKYITTYERIVKLLEEEMASTSLNLKLRKTMKGYKEKKATTTGSFNVKATNPELQGALMKELFTLNGTFGQLMTEMPQYILYQLSVEELNSLTVSNNIFDKPVRCTVELDKGDIFNSSSNKYLKVKRAVENTKGTLKVKSAAENAGGAGLNAGGRRKTRKVSEKHRR